VQGPAIAEYEQSLTTIPLPAGSKVLVSYIYFEKNEETRINVRARGGVGLTETGLMFVFWWILCAPIYG